MYYWDKDHVQFNTSGIERSHRFMGVGEGSNEIPGHVLDELRKRPVYYKPQTVNEIPVRKIYAVYCVITDSYHRLVDTHFTVVDYALEEILSHAPFMERSYLAMRLAGHVIPPPCL